MQFGMMSFVALFCVFMVQSAGRTVYVHIYEFQPAVMEWKAAKERGDEAGMLAAFKKEQRAHERTIDPFWFLNL